MASTRGAVVTEWNGLLRGDAVKVKNVRGNFTFFSAQLSEGGETLWVTVFGGTWQHAKFRHFPADLIATIKKGGKR